MLNETTNQASQETGTTERLFGTEEAEASNETTPEPVADTAPEPSKEAKRDESGKFVSQKAEPQSNANDDEYIPVESLANKKLKIKVNGEEKELTFSEALRNIQTNEYLTQKGQKLAEEYRQLQAMKAHPEQTKAASVQHANIPDDDFTREYIKPYADNQDIKITALQQELERLKSIAGPLEYQNNLGKVDADMKRAGYDDFMQYVPKITETILNLPIEQQMAYDTDWGFKSIYKDIKLSEMKEALSKSKTPSSLPDQRPKPKMVSVESGGGTPTGNDDRLSHLTALKDRASQSGSTRDWANFIDEKLRA